MVEFQHIPFFQDKTIVQYFQGLEILN